MDYDSSSLKELHKLRMAFEQTPGAIFILDKHFRFEYINPGFERLSGYSKEDLRNKTVADIFYGEEIHESRKEVVESMLKGEKWEGELLTHNKNGNTYWANSIASPYKDENGAIEGYIIVQQDITDRKNMETALQESEAKYKTLVENSQDGIIIVRDNEVIFANNTICNILGYKLIGLKAEDIIHPDDLYKVVAIGARRHNQDFSTINESFRMIAKNGDIKECDTLSTIIQFGGIWASFFTIHDVTESKRIQLELVESEEKYRQLFSAESDAIFMIDADSGQILDVNPATTTIYGYSREELLQMKNTDVSAEPEQTQTATEKKQAIVSHRLHKRKDGSIISVELSAGFTTFKNRNVQIVTSRDITARKAMENALRESEAKYRTLIDNSQDGIFAIEGDAILFANKTFCKLIGYTPDELYGLPSRMLVHPDDQKRGLEISELRKQGDYSTINEIFRLVTKDGNIREADVFSSVVELNGKTTSLITVHDLTDTRKMQKQLEASEEKYRSLIEKATDGIVIVQNGLLKFANQTMCDIMHYSMGELIEKPFLDYIEDSDHAMLSAFHNRRMEGEHFSNILRSQFIRKDGIRITVELNARTSNYNGSPAGFIVIRDITERLNIENELKEAKTTLEKLNNQLELRVKESSDRLTEARTQLINLQKENLQSQFDVLKQQVNPHFLFNSLNVLTSLIKIEPDLAETFSEQLSKVYRYVLENKDNELVDLQTELNFLDAYIFLLNIRFVGKLNVTIDIPADRRNDKIIPLAMQLLIENAIKHNTMSKTEPLSIAIFIDQADFLNIVNNLQERPSQLVSTGVGLKNIQNRYLLLNNTEPIFEKTETQFIAKVPLVVA